MIFESIYMIRGGSFGLNWNLKLLITIITIITVIYDWKKNDRLDYLWIFLFGTIIWSFVELFLQAAEIRIMPEKFLFGIEIPLLISIPLQGISEGSALAVLGTFAADRIQIKETRKLTIISFVIFLCCLAFVSLRGQVQLPFVGIFVPSRRKLFTISSLVFLTSMVAIDIIFFIKADHKPRKRAFYLLIVMLTFATIWTVSEWLAGTRWIETGSFPFYNRAPPLIEFGGLAFDVIIEIVLAYVTFLAIPYMLNLIESD